MLFATEALRDGPLGAVRTASSMQVFGPELHVFPLRAYLDATEEVLGGAGLEALLAPYGIALRDLQDPNAWVTLEFAETFVKESARLCNDPEHIARAMRRGMTAKYLGALMPLLVAFGTPLSVFQAVAKGAARFNKTGAWSFERGAQAGHVRMTFKLHPHIKPEQGIICPVRQLQLALVPTLFEQPIASVQHPRCMQRGDDACVYDVTWSELPARKDARVGALIGLALALPIVLCAALHTWLALLVTALLLVAGFCIGQLRVVHSDLRARAQEIDSHNAALANMMRANEERFAELLEAKAEVEEKVEQRTLELQAATQRLSEALNKLQEVDRTKTDFFNNVSHELRAPLTLILAPLDELLAGRQLPGSEHSAYATMHRNASRLLRLINQLLDLAKIDAGQMRIAAAVTDLPALLRSSIQGFEAAAGRKGVTLTAAAPEAMAPMLLDASWIDSAITNLVANALRLTDAGGSVRVSIEDFGAHVTLSVSDDGPGIADEDRAKIFERFAQGDSAKRVIGGTGIGLALVREAARLHSGDVELTSELGKGSTFTLKLPRLAANDMSPVEGARPSLRFEKSLLDEASALSADRAGPNPAAPLALIVEDNAELRTFIADVLAVRYRVRAAENGVQGLQLARQLRPDVVVSDVAMPEMDGYELCRRLRSSQETKTIPVLLVTARAEASSVLQGFEAGANDYLLKPFNATELLARVDVHVRLRRLVSQLARQERLAALGSLAASVAHNVRNPLSALISGLPAIRTRLSATLDPATNELMGIMYDCAERIERMTLDLLDLSRIDRELDGEFAPGAGLLLCTRMAESRLAGRVQLLAAVDDRAIASGRAGELNHVFMNVIDNALRALQQTEQTGTIEVRGAVERDSYVVTVADSGPGIAPSELERVFEPFYTTRAAGEGTGLGLSIARQIVEGHRGSITAGRAGLGGALFTITLPIKAQRATA